MGLSLLLRGFHLREIDKMNDLLRQELGSCELGGRFQWKLSQDVCYGFLQTRSFTTPTGMHMPAGVDKWTKMTYADRKGPNIWMLCKWTPPAMSETEWINKYGMELEYPAKGALAPTDVAMKPGVKPTMALTRDLVGMIREQMEEDYADHLARVTAEAESRDKENAARMQDAFENEYDAEDKRPENVIYSLPN